MSVQQEKQIREHSAATTTTTTTVTIKDSGYSLLGYTFIGKRAPLWTYVHTRSIGAGAELNLI